MESFRVVKVFRPEGREVEMFKLVAPSYDDAMAYLQTRDDCNYIPEPNAEMILLLRDTALFLVEIIVLIDDGDPNPEEVVSYSFHQDGIEEEVKRQAVALAQKHLEQQMSHGLVTGARARVTRV